jgi:hypothetical protein
MPSSQTPQVKLKILSTLAENSGIWIPKTSLASKSGTKPERIQDTLDSFEKRSFVKSLNWELLTKKERDDFSKKQPTDVGSTTKILYQLDVEGWKKLQSSLQDCFENENVLELLNIPEDIKGKLS